MNHSVMIDKADRFVLPKEIRARLGLSAGDIMDVELSVNEVCLRPQHAATAHVIRVDNRAVWDAPHGAATVEEIERALQHARSERDVRAAGL